MSEVLSIITDSEFRFVLMRWPDVRGETMVAVDISSNRTLCIEKPVKRKNTAPGPAKSCKGQAAQWKQDLRGRRR